MVRRVVALVTGGEREDDPVARARSRVFNSVYIISSGTPDRLDKRIVDRPSKAHVRHGAQPRRSVHPGDDVGIASGSTIAENLYWNNRHVWRHTNDPNVIVLCPDYSGDMGAVTILVVRVLAGGEVPGQLFVYVKILVVVVDPGIEHTN